MSKPSSLEELRKISDGLTDAINNYREITDGLLKQKDERIEKLEAAVERLWELAHPLPETLEKFMGVA